MFRNLRLRAGSPALAAIGMAVLFILIAATQTAAADITAVVGGTLIDGFGGKPTRNSVILIEDERIIAVGQVGTVSVPAGAKVISTEGMSVLPGLWDMHVHLMINGHADYRHWDETYPPLFESVIMPSSAHQLLLAGVTSARDLGADRDQFGGNLESRRRRSAWPQDIDLRTCTLSRREQIPSSSERWFPDPTACWGPVVESTPPANECTDASGP